MGRLGPPEARALDGIDGDEVHHGVASLDEIGQTLDLLGRVVDARHQRPLDLGGVSRLIGVVERSLEEGLDGNVLRVGEKLPAQRVVRGVEAERERGTHGERGQAIEEPVVAHGRDHDVLVRESAHVAEELHRLADGVEVVARFAHAHQDDLPDVAAHPPGLAVLRDDLGARELAHEATLARHAEDAPDGAAHLSRDAQSLPGQQHRLDALAVLKPENELDGLGLGASNGQRMREAVKTLPDAGQRLGHGLRKALALSGLPRGKPRPGKKDAPNVLGLRAQRLPLGGEFAQMRASGHGCSFYILDGERKAVILAHAPAAFSGSARVRAKRSPTRICYKTTKFNVPQSRATPYTVFMVFSIRTPCKTRNFLYNSSLSRTTCS